MRRILSRRRVDPAGRREHQRQCYLAQHYFQFCVTLAVMRDEELPVKADAKFGMGELVYNRNTEEDGRVTRVYEFEGSVMYEVAVRAIPIRADHYFSDWSESALELSKYANPVHAVAEPMPLSQPPLDPRQYPWRRGDVCTLSAKSGFVLNYTSEYLEVRWMPEGVVERLTDGDAESVIRHMHADSISPSGKTTNLGALERIEALTRIEDAIRERMKTVKSEAEKKELDALVKRSFNPECAFDRKYRNQLATLAIAPDELSLFWKLRERIHRVVHHH